MEYKDDLKIIIQRLARKNAALYSYSSMDQDDLEQEGYLKLAEISCRKDTIKNFHSYAITAISRAMREAAIKSTSSVSAPYKDKILFYKIRNMIASGLNETEICDILDITKAKLSKIKTIVKCKSFDQLYFEPSFDQQPYYFLSDILSSKHLRIRDKRLILSKIYHLETSGRVSAKSLWRKLKRLRTKMNKIGYRMTSV